MSMLFAATYPDRTTALVTFGIYANDGSGRRTTRGRRDRRRGGEIADASSATGATGLGSGAVTAPSARRALSERGSARYIGTRRQPRRGGRAAADEHARSTCATSCRAIRVPTLVMHRDGRPRRRHRRGRATSPRASRARASSSSRATTTCPGSATTGPIRRRDRGVPDRRPAAPASPTACSRRSCSPIIVGSTETRRASSATSGWRELLDAPPRARPRASSRATAAREVDTAGDGFLARFDGPARAIRCAARDRRRRPSRARPRGARRPAHGRVRARRRRRSPGSPSTSARGSQRWRGRARSSSPRPCTISSRARASGSAIAAAPS